MELKGHVAECVFDYILKMILEKQILMWTIPVGLHDTFSDQRICVHRLEESHWPSSSFLQKHNQDYDSGEGDYLGCDAEKDFETSLIVLRGSLGAGCH